ncbi:MAG: ABC transporter ATP-binding protein/permease [Eubacterium sp.]|nr:ABC transporter ATP-binding protein/permease [Eubacterium sp.]
MFKLLKKLSKKEVLMVIFCIAFVVVQVWLELKMPDYMNKITRLVETEGSKMGEILKNGGIMLLCALFSMVASVFTGYFAAQVAAGLSMTLREKVFKKVMTFNNEEIGRFSTSSLITRTTNDITQVQMLIAIGLQALIRAPILMVWAITKISNKQWQWSFVVAASVLMILIMFLCTVVVCLPRFRKIQTLTDDINRVTRENLIGIRVVRAYNAEDFQENKFEEVNDELTKTHLFTGRVMAIIGPTMTIIMSGISLAIYWIGAYLIKNVNLTDASGIPNPDGYSERLDIFSDMVVFSSYAIQIVMSFMLLSIMFVILPRVMVSVKRINEVIDTDVSILSGEVKDGVPGLEGTVEFRNVSFRYPDGGDDVLHDISFTAKQGETIAFIGATASGKSSLINLIPRFFDAREGGIYVDGINVKDYDLHVLRSKIGYVAQKATMFSGTVASNVAYTDGEISEKNLDEALSIAQAAEFVSQMQDGNKAAISQGGTNVSGGQRQRLSIARAIYKRPEIYIFDDSFSALDYRTDKELRKTLKEKTGDATKLIVAQRIGTIRDADKIIVLEDGCVAGIGKHKDLMENCPAYQEIAYSQLSKEELEDAR